MIDIKTQFADLLSAKVGIPADELMSTIEVPPDPKLGDLAFPCFVLSKKLKKNPVEISKELSASLKLPKIFSSMVSNGPYLNIFLNKTAFIQEVLKEVAKKGKTKKFDKRIIVEYMNANPNKPLHIGQARNVCIGDTLVRIYRHLGYPVDAVNYGDDSGVNIGYNIAGHLFYDIPLDAKGKKFDHYCGEIYTRMRSLEEDEKFKKKLSKVLNDVEDNKGEAARLQKELTRKCAIAQFESCWRMNSYFNLVNWETDILHLKFFEKTFDRLKKTGYVKQINEGEFAGCWVFDTSTIDEFKGEKTDFTVLVKSDGVVLYAAKDIVYAMWKLGILGEDFFYKKLVKQPNKEFIWSTMSVEEGSEKASFGNYDIAVAVIDNRQTREQNIVKAALRVFGYTGEKKQYVHLPYGVVYLTPKTLMDFGFKLTDEEKGEKRLPFASRKGWFITIDETLDKLKKKAYEESKKRNPDKDEEWLNETAEKLAVGAFRFFLTRTDKDRDLTFDIDEALNMEGETGTYIQYTYARICNIFAKAGKYNKKANIDLLNEGIEFEISKKLNDFPVTLERTVSTLSPNLLCQYLLVLCSQFNTFYTSCPIIKSEEALRDARLVLLEGIQKVLKAGMNLAGIDELERM